MFTNTMYLFISEATGRHGDPRLAAARYAAPARTRARSRARPAAAPAAPSMHAGHRILADAFRIASGFRGE